MQYDKIRDWINKSRFWKLQKSGKIMLVTGIIITSILIIMAIFADFLSPFDPYTMHADTLLKPLNGSHILGTDSLGRDVYSRCLFGMRISILIGLGAMLLALSVGSILGVIFGYYGGVLDRALTLFMDALWSLPSFITALIISVVLGPSIQNTTLAISIGWTAAYYRIVKSLAISLKEEDFVYGEISMGASDIYIIFHHVFPLCFSAIIVLLTMGIAQSIIVAAGLGFLGLGVSPPTPELGADLSQGRQFIPTGIWWPTVAPSLFIFAIILGFNLLGEGLNLLLGTTLKEI